MKTATPAFKMFNKVCPLDLSGHQRQKQLSNLRQGQFGAVTFAVETPFSLLLHPSGAPACGGEGCAQAQQQIKLSTAPSWDSSRGRDP